MSDVTPSVAPLINPRAPAWSDAHDEPSDEELDHRLELQERQAVRSELAERGLL